MLDSWLPFLIYGFFALAIPVSMMVMSFVFATRPHRRYKARALEFESVFLYPLAVILHQLKWFGFVEFSFFLLILAVAYVYIWRKGALEWR